MEKKVITGDKHGKTLYYRPLISYDIVSQS